MTHINDIYGPLLAKLANGSGDSYVELNKRTQHRVAILQGAQFFKIDLRNGLLPIPGNRRMYPYIAAAETAWQFLGTQDPAFILRHAPKLWSKFLDSDGKIPAAYGWRWRTAFNRDQIRLLIHELKNNPTNRQLFVSTWDPSRDGLGGKQPANVPCITGFSVTRQHNLIHMSVFLRSSDVFVGLPYDIIGYALTLDAIAASVGAFPGILSFTLAHAHLYEAHWDMARQCLKYNHTWLRSSQELPRVSVGAIVEVPDFYVVKIKQMSAAAPETSHDWDPKPELVL